MGMTITEKILAAHSAKGDPSLRPGDIVLADVDLALGNDITAPIAIDILKDNGIERVFDPSKIALVPDHFAPNKDIASAEQCRFLREFAREYAIEHYFEQGEVGIEHVLLPELGLVIPGDLVIGADSHTCTYGALGAFATGVGSTDLAGAMMGGKVWFRVPETVRLVYSGSLGKWVGGKDLILYTIGKLGVDGLLYRAMELSGDTIPSLPMADRLTMCNMAIEAGAKNGIIEPDHVTMSYVEGRTSRRPTLFQSDADADVADVIEIDASAVELQVSLPHSPENAVPVSEIASTPIDQVVIGSCTNGRIEDLRVAARVLKGKHVAKGMRCLIFPGSPAVNLQALKEGLTEIFLEAGVVMSAPTCGPCLGGHMGVLAKGERALATTNRNFVGRMGHPESEVYLCGPAVAAASAVAGEISSPEEV